MPTTSPLTPEMDRWIDERVRAGAFKDRDEALRQAVRLLKRDEEQHQAKLAALNAAIHAGIDSGPGIEIDDLDEYFDQINAEIDAEIAAEDEAAAAAAAE